MFSSLGGYSRIVTDAEMQKRRSFRRSLVARHALVKGHFLSQDDLTAKRPATGIPPNEIAYVVGRRLADNVDEDQAIRWQDLE